MIFDSHDIIAIESQIEIADYVRESAKFEIDRGNEVYISVYEAATETSDKGNSNWVVSVANKIKIFAKSAVAKLRMVLNQLATKFRKVKAVRIQKKMASGKFDKNELKDNGNEPIGAALNTIQKYGNSMSSKVVDCCSKFGEYVRNKNVPKSREEFNKVYLGLDGGAKVNTSDTLPFSTAKSYIDNAVNYLINLSKSTSNMSGLVKKLKDDGIGSSEIRYGISTMYNHMTAAVREYYSAAITVAKYFMKNSNAAVAANNDNASAQTASGKSRERSEPEATITPEEAKEVIDEAENIFKDLANKLNIDDDEISKITRQYKAEVEKAGNEWKNIRTSGNGLKQLPETVGYIRNIETYNKFIKQLDAYAERMHKIIKRQIENSETEESYKDAKALFAEADKVWRELVHKKFDKVLSRDQIKNLENSFSGMDIRTETRFNTADEIAEKGQDIINLDKLDDILDIQRFVNYAKTLPSSTRKKVKERAITKCNKIIRKYRKKYGSDVNPDDMPYMDRTRYEKVFELRKQLKSL